MMDVGQDSSVLFLHDEYILRSSTWPFHLLSAAPRPCFIRPTHRMDLRRHTVDLVHDGDEYLGLSHSEFLRNVLSFIFG